METLISISYWICGAGLAVSVLAYFLIPIMIRMALRKQKQEDIESETEES